MRFFTILFIICSAFALCAKDISIVSNGKSDYTIVVDKNASEIDKFAARELQTFIEKMTKVKLPVAESASGKKIVIGPTANIHNDENVIDAKDGNIRLYGGGIHGNLWAVYELLENHFGIIFFNAYGDCHIPQTADLAVREGKHSVRYAFPKRGMMNFFYNDKATATIYMYRNRCNILLVGSNHPREPISEKGVFGLDVEFMNAHSFSRLIPPGVKNRNSYLQNKALPFVKDKKYFVTNPEFFSMDESGKRVPDRQLCFTNKGLIKELEKNILIHFNTEKKRTGMSGIIELSANDVYNRICCCKPCIALDEKYGVRGMAMLLAICEIAERNPQIPFRAMAYQRGQSLIPPKKAIKWPKNLALIFAPINGDFANPLTSKENAIEYKAIKDWTKFTKDIVFWYYPNPYNRQRDRYLVLPPTFMTDRLSKDYKLMRDIGIAGFYTEHDSGGIYEATNFSELQTYIMFKLMQNPDCDTDKLTRYFIKHYYGPAAPHIQQFHDALAAEMRAFCKKGGHWYYNTADYSFLNPPNMKRFDAMINAAEKAADGEYAFRVRTFRLGFDSAYVAVVPEDHKARLEKMEKNLKEFIAKRPSSRVTVKRFNSWKKEIYSGASAKKLPAELANIDYKYLLDYFAPSSGKTIVKDPDANLGRAFAETWNRKKPFGIGTYDSVSKKYGAGLGISPSMIKGEGFHFYTFPRPIKLTNSTLLFGGSWNMLFRIGSKVFHDDAASADKEYLVHVSLKFEKNRVLCDRVVLQEKVKLPPKALPAHLAKLPASDIIVIESPDSAKNTVTCSDGSCGRAVYEDIDTSKPSFILGVYHQKKKSYGSSLGINYKTAKKDEFKLYTMPRPGVLNADSIFFCGRWRITMPIGRAVAAKGAEALKKKWQIIASIKFSDNKAYVDRLILVAK